MAKQGSLLKAKISRRTDEVKRKALQAAGSEELKRINVNVPKSFHRKVKTFSYKVGKDMGSVVMDALNEYMSKYSTEM